MAYGRSKSKSNREPKAASIITGFIFIIFHLEEDIPENRKQDDQIGPSPYRV